MSNGYVESWLGGSVGVVNVLTYACVVDGGLDAGSDEQPADKWILCLQIGLRTHCNVYLHFSYKPIAMTPASRGRNKMLIPDALSIATGDGKARILSAGDHPILVIFAFGWGAHDSKTKRLSTDSKDSWSFVKPLIDNGCHGRQESLLSADQISDSCALMCNGCHKRVCWTLIG
jgi:hypothetical protein